MKLNLKSVDLNLLTVFEAIMEAGQLSKAGDYLGMSQPAVSAALNRLRVTLKDDLFIRTHKGMIPTPRARALHGSVREAMEIIRMELQNVTDFDPGQCQRHFRVLGGDYVEVLYLGPLLNSINTLAPQVSCEVRPLQISGFEEDLCKGELDFVVHYMPPTDIDLVFEPVFQDKLVVVARRNHPRIKKKVTEIIFKQEMHVTLFPADDGLNHLDLFLNRRKVDRNVNAQVIQFINMIPVVLNTNYLCVMPNKLACYFRNFHDIEVYDIPFSLPPLPIHLVWAKRFDQDLAHQWFREQLITLMKREF